MIVFIISLVVGISAFISAHPRGNIPASIVWFFALGYMVGTPTAIGEGLWWQYLIAPAAAVAGAIAGEFTFPDPIEYQMQQFEKVREKMEEESERLDGYT